VLFLFFFSSRRRHTRFSRDWSSDVCSSDLWCLRSPHGGVENAEGIPARRGPRLAAEDEWVPSADGGGRHGQAPVESAGKAQTRPGGPGPGGLAPGGCFG